MASSTTRFGKPPPSDDRFTQRRPNDGTAPSVRTTVQVSFDSENLYFGIQAYDPNPEKISARLARRDSLVDSDNIEIFLDNPHDHDNGYWFRINAAGVLADAQIHDNSRLNLQWNAVWRGEILQWAYSPAMLRAH